MRLSLRVVLALALAFLVHRGFAAESAAPSTTDSLEGRLPNGFHYLIVPHTPPAGGISVRLLVHAGSLDEREGEQGYAHLVEHLAFNGTTHYPRGTLIPFFQRLGLGWGADLNADTRYNVTSYRLDLPREATDAAGQALGVFRDFADGLTFDPAAIEKEKNVVLSELESRTGRHLDVFAERLRFLYAGTIAADRLPIGQRDPITHASAETLRAFYHRNYQPRRMTLLVVGDIPPETARALIETTFGSLAADPQAVDAYDLPMPRLDGPRVGVLTGSGRIGGAISLMNFLPADPPTAEGHRASLGKRLVSLLFYNRLAMRKEAARSTGYFDVQRSLAPTGTSELFELISTGTDKNWPDALDFLEQERRLVLRDGFTAQEIERGRRTAQSAAHSGEAQWASVSNADAAQDIEALLLQFHSWRSPRERREETERWIGTYSPDELRAIFAELWPDRKLWVKLERGLPFPDGTAKLQAQFEKSLTSPLRVSTPKTDAGAREFAAAKETPATDANVVRRWSEADLGIESVLYRNDVRLNLHPSRVDPGRFELSMRMGRGYVDAPLNVKALPFLAETRLGFNVKIGGRTPSEIKRLLEQHQVTAYRSVDDGQLHLRLLGPSSELPFALEYVARYFNEFDFGDEGFFGKTAVLDATLSAYTGWHTDLAPSTATISAATTRLLGGDVRLEFPPITRMPRPKLKALDAFILERWIRGPVEIGLSGDFELEPTLALAHSHLGPLAPRAPRAISREEGFHVSPTPFRDVIATNEPGDAAFVRIVWGYAGGTFGVDEPALAIAMDALRDRLRLKLREELGVTYAPDAGVNSQRDLMDFACVDLSLPPGRAQELAGVAIAEATRLATNGITAEELERLRKARLSRTQIPPSQHNNTWWACELLDQAQSRPELLEVVRHIAQNYAELTPEAVTRAARQFLSADHASYVVLNPKPTAPAANKR